MKANLLKFITFIFLLCGPALLAQADTAQIIGIKDNDLRKIPIGIIAQGITDTDNDGIDNDLEKAIGTNPANKDSDNDGFDDRLEILTNHNPLGYEPSYINAKLAKKLAGTYLLQVENGGQLWYVNQKDNRRYFIRSLNSYNSLRTKIYLPALSSNAWPKPTVAQPPITPETNVLDQAAIAIRSGNRSQLENLCATSSRQLAIYNFNYLKPESRFIWANIISSAKLISQTANEKIYEAQIFVDFANKKVPQIYKTEKQPDGTWLISKL